MRLGWFMVAAAVVAGAGAALVRDDSEAAGIAVTAGLLFAASGTVYGGAPFARDGKPSVLRITVLFLLGVAGLALVVAVDWLVALAVAYASFGIVVLSLARWPPPDAPLQRAPGVRPPLGLPVALFGTFLTFSAFIAAFADLTDSQGLRLALLAALVVVLTLCWGRLRAVYVGRAPSR